MSHHLMRDDAPLSHEEWERIDRVVTETAQKILVGRRFVPVAGPYGAGMQVVPADTYQGGKGWQRTFLPLEEINHDFTLAWRDVEASRQYGLPLELGVAGMASAACAQAEDKLILGALLGAKGRNSVPLSNWDEMGNAFADVVAAREKLVSANFFGPYAVVLSPALYAKTQRIYKSSGRLEIKMIKDVAKGGVFQSPLLKANQGFVISQGPQNVDLVIGQDLVTAYLGPEGMDHNFRVLESLALRIKQPGAICVFG